MISLRDREANPLILAWTHSLPLVRPWRAFGSAEFFFLPSQAEKISPRWEKESAPGAWRPITVCGSSLFDLFYRAHATPKIQTTAVIRLNPTKSDRSIFDMQDRSKYRMKRIAILGRVSSRRLRQYPGVQVLGNQSPSGFVRLCQTLEFKKNMKTGAAHRSGFHSSLLVGGTCVRPPNGSRRATKLK
jgi:hypothetical protein